MNDFKAWFREFYDAMSAAGFIGSEIVRYGQHGALFDIAEAHHLMGRTPAEAADIEREKHGLKRFDLQPFFEHVRRGLRESKTIDELKPGQFYRLSLVIKVDDLGVMSCHDLTLQWIKPTTGNEVK